VSGSGKSTIAGLLAERLGWDRAEGDDLHPAANVEKMRAGVPLTDDDRWPWLELVGKWVAGQRAVHRPGVITCSALRRAYRDKIRGDGNGDCDGDGTSGIVFVYLKGAKEQIAERMAARRDHFMPAGLLDSQIETLEPPGRDENVLIVDTDRTPADIADDVINRLGLLALD
jgi:carbohydrate kinase (thermoresistant glucokinase family)